LKAVPKEAELFSHDVVESFLDNSKEHDGTSGKERRVVLKAKAKLTKAESKLSEFDLNPTTRPLRKVRPSPLRKAMGHQTLTYQSPSGHLTPTTRPLRKLWPPPLQSTVVHPTSTCKSAMVRKTPRHLRTTAATPLRWCLTSLAGMKPSTDTLQPHPEFFWTELSSKRHARGHAARCHPQWAVWNATPTQNREIPSDIDDAIFVLYWALDTAAHQLPHEIGHQYDTLNGLVTIINQRIGIAIAYASGGKLLWGGKWWERYAEQYSNRSESDAGRKTVGLAAKTLVRKYGVSLVNAVTDLWDVNATLTHQAKVDLYCNPFLVPYCIDAVRSSENKFPNMPTNTTEVYH
jgi:hypothetical protein